jgi:hypothetical protein
MIALFRGEGAEKFEKLTAGVRRELVDRVADDVRCTRSARWKRTAMPRGFAFGSVSGSSGIPVEFENRIVTGVHGRAMCGAFVSEGASDDGSISRQRQASPVSSASVSVCSKSWRLSPEKTRMLVLGALVGSVFRRREPKASRARLGKMTASSCAACQVNT